MITTLVLLIVLPLATAAAIVLLGRWPNLREAAGIVGGLILFALVVSCIGPVADGARPSLVLFQMLPGIVFAFTLEPLGLIFALVASGLWIVTAIYAIGYMRGNGEAHQTRFYAFFALAIAAAMGVALAGNLITLYLFYELLTLSTFPLVTHKGDAKARRGGRMYLGYLLGTSIGLLLPALVITWVVAGTLDFRLGGVLQGNLGPGAAMALYALFAFGIGKAALMPFHRWLPEAMVAPTPVSALLHAVAVVKAGVFAVLKITVYIFGLDFASSTSLTTPILWVAAATILIASLVALTRDNLKERLAYSTISQLGYVVLGASLATGMGVLGSGLQIVMHAVGKITLFFCAGAIYTAAHKTRVSELDGLGRAMPWTFAAFALAAISIIGLPPAGGTWSKWFLMAASWDAGHPLLIAVLAVSSLLNIAYLLDIPARAFFRRGDAIPGGLREAPLACVLPLCATAAGCLVLFFAGGALLDLLRPVIAP